MAYPGPEEQNLQPFAPRLVLAEGWPTTGRPPAWPSQPETDPAQLWEAVGAWNRWRTLAERAGEVILDPERVIELGDTLPIPSEANTLRVTLDHMTTVRPGAHPKDVENLLPRSMPEARANELTARMAVDALYAGPLIRRQADRDGAGVTMLSRGVIFTIPDHSERPAAALTMQLREDEPLEPLDVGWLPHGIVLGRVYRSINARHVTRLVRVSGATLLRPSQDGFLPRQRTDEPR